MNVLNKVIVATLPAIPKPIIRHFASRYIAGENLGDAVRVVEGLNSRGIMATLDVLGEDIHNREEAVSSRDTILQVFDAIAHHKLRSNVSVKLTQLGLKQDRSFCLATMKEVVARAGALQNFVRIDMEDSSVTDDTIWVYRELRKDFRNVGIVLQGYLRRTLGDAETLMGGGLKNFRLCKGIYIEPEALAYKPKDEINRNFLLVLESMFRGGAYVGIATHDDQLIDGAYGLIKKYNLSPDQYEFQMLLGVRPELRTKILTDGHKLRVYVPFGRQWYQYSIRRFKENPRVAGQVLKALFTRNRSN